MSKNAAKKIPDKKCDVWSFGCILYELSTGLRLISSSLRAISEIDQRYNKINNIINNLRLPNSKGL
jgi:serine/threonine protein kinase